MTIDDIANFCEVKDCSVTLEAPDVGFVTVDGTGPTSKFNNYRRFLYLNELSSLPDPKAVLAEAETFRVHSDQGEEELSRDEFLDRFSSFQKLIDD